MKAVVWMGGSRTNLKAFPADVCRKAGYQRERLQRGLEPDDC
jgi:phage-related protein